MQLLDGKSLSAELIDSVKEEAKKLKPKLAVILVGEDPASLIRSFNNLFLSLSDIKDPQFFLHSPGAQGWEILILHKK